MFSHIRGHEREVMGGSWIDDYNSTTLSGMTSTEHITEEGPHRRDVWMKMYDMDIWIPKASQGMARRLCIWGKICWMLSAEVSMRMVWGMVMSRLTN